MIILVILVAVIVSVSIMSVVFAFIHNESPKNNVGICNLTEKDYIQGIAKLAREYSKVKKGGRLESLDGNESVRKACAMIARKSLKGEPLLECEKWLYENSFLIGQAIESPNFDRLCSLPSVRGNIRIVALAAYIISASSCTLSYGRIKRGISEFNSNTCLCFAEVESFKTAAIYAVVQELCDLSKEIIAFNKDKCAGLRGKHFKNNLTNSVYLHYLSKSNVISELEEDIVDLGIDYRNSECAFYSYVAELDAKAKYLIEALRCLDEMYSSEELPELFSPVTAILNKAEGFQNSNLESKLDVLSRLASLSEKLNISDIVVAKKLYVLAEYNNEFVGNVLIFHKKELRSYLQNGNLVRFKNKSNDNQIVYILSIIVLALSLSVCVFLLTKSIICMVFSILPLIITSEKTINGVLSHFVKPRIVYRCDKNKVPNGITTNIVVSEYICSEEDAVRAVKNADVLAAGAMPRIGGGNSFTICLLVDLKTSESIVQESDTAIIKVFKEAVESRTHLTVYIRNRIRTGKKYQGWERKRGAILNLCESLISGDFVDFRCVFGKKALLKPTYIITLDSDNVLPVGGAQELVAAMVHPANKSYELLALQGRYNLFSLETIYSKKYAVDAGAVIYPYYTDLFQGLFGLDVYSGKGIFKPEVFISKLKNKFPEHKILSHDLIEGAVLKTGYGGVVYEDAPKTLSSSIERNNRWRRGDIMLLPYVFGGMKNNKGEKPDFAINSVYKWLYIRNFISILYPINIIALVAIVAFIPLAYWAFVFAPLFCLVFEAMGVIICGIKSRTRVRYLTNNIFTSVLINIENLLMCPFEAVNNMVLIAIMLKRIIAKNNLLEWKTFAEGQKSNGLHGKVARASIMLLALGIVCYIAGGNVLIVGCLFVISIALALVENELGINSHKESKYKKMLNSYAEKTYGYFKYMRSNEKLISDNLQIKPYKGMSNTTSPTNLGFEILAEVCAVLLGFQTKSEFASKVERDIEKLEELPKWHGNLYNWYDVNSLKPINGVVSSVDSGNLLTCLYVLSSYLLEINEKNLAERVKKIIDETDIRALYDEKLSKFYISYDENTGKFAGHYDMLASEARLLSYIFCARLGDATNWQALKRPYTGLLGNTLLSWSGTMFEYTMPELFIKSPCGSIMEKTCKNVAKKQRKTKIRGLFGISESGYSKFDNDLNYQYMAFGIPSLALNKNVKEGVVSSYAGLLSLGYNKDKFIIDNIQKLEQVGMVQEFGFLESVDMNGGVNIVESYMTHHQGMIIAAITNRLLWGRLTKLFNCAPEIKMFSIALSERPEYVRFSGVLHEKYYKISNLQSYYYKYHNNIEYYDDGIVLKAGDITYLCNAYGSGFCSYRGTICERYKPLISFRNRFLYYSDCLGGYYNVFKDISSLESDFITEFDGCEFSYSSKIKSTKYTTKICSLFDAVINELSFYGLNSVNDVCFYERLALGDLLAQNAHPVYNNMFVITEYLAEFEAVLAYRNTTINEKPIYILFKVYGVKDIRYETNCYNVNGNSVSQIINNLRENVTFSYQNTPSFGEVLEPCLAFYGSIIKNKPIQFVKIFGISKQDVLEKLIKFESFSAKNSLPYSRFDSAIVERVSKLYLACEYGSYKDDLLHSIELFGDCNEFFGLIKGKYLVYYEYYGKNSKFLFKKLANIIKSLQNLGKGILFSIGLISCDSSERALIANTISAFGIEDCVIVDNLHDMMLYKQSAFLVLDSNLLFESGMLGGKHYISEDCEFEHFRANNDEKSAIFERLAGKSLYKSGKGMVCENGYRIDRSNDESLLPYSFVCANKNGGFVTTEYGRGVVFGDNSHECRYTEFDGEPLFGEDYEGIYIESNNSYYKLNGSGLNCSVLVGESFISYYSNIGDSSYILTSYMLKNGIKVNKLEGNINKSTKVIYNITAICGSQSGSPLIYSKRMDNDIVTFKNLQNGCCFAARILYNNANVKIFDDNGRVIMVLETSGDMLNDCVFLCIGRPDEISQLEYYELSNYSDYLKKTTIIALDSPNICLDEMFNNRLLSQVYNSRLNGKCGYYQLGGATGFRDQLQDVRCLLQADPLRAREQILLHASRQYEEGDVMHWWHEPTWGLRSKISDDKLFLPFLVAEYVYSTCDFAILDVQVPYITSSPLADGENSRYECAKISKNCDSIYSHCIKALKSALIWGDHGLLRMFSGDWNDGMDYICSRGVGDSIPLSAFFVWTVNKFKPYFRGSDCEFFAEIAQKLANSINIYGYDGKQYLRLFADDGTAFGGFDSDVLSIDLLSQSFAVLSQVAVGERTENALKSAEKLIDYDLKVIKLLDPPLMKANYFGYISAYPNGVRENGGQYTHAAIWYIMSLFEAGFIEKGAELLEMINPMERCKDERLNVLYGGEPYAMPADVYTGANGGRMGWSYYTGSASWYYVLILEVFFGVKRHGNKLFIEPKLTPKYSGSKMKYLFDGTVLNITFFQGDEYSLAVNGLKRHNCSYFEPERGADIDVVVHYTFESRRM